MGKSNIGWCDYVWNPIAGCTKVSAGCKNCWAETMAVRLKGMGHREYQDVVDDDGHWTGQVNCLEHRLEQPLHWRKPRRIFVCSMSDLFHPFVPFDFIAQVFDTMASPRAKQHTFILLTKRADRALHFYNWLRARFGAGGLWSAHRTLELWMEEQWPLPNVWVLATVENNDNRGRLDHLLRIPAAVRGVCLEPMLESINLGPWLTCPACDGVGHWGDAAHCPVCRGSGHASLLHWLVIGGESGPGRRPFDPKWASNALKQGRDAGAAVWLKQGSGVAVPLLDEEGREVKEWPQ